MHLADVTNRGNCTATFTQTIENFKGLLKRFWVERPEPFVNEQCIEVDSSGFSGDNIGKTECERQGGEKGLPARKRRG